MSASVAAVASAPALEEMARRAGLDNALSYEQQYARLREEQDPDYVRENRMSAVYGLVPAVHGGFRKHCLRQISGLRCTYGHGHARCLCEGVLDRGDQDGAGRRYGLSWSGRIDSSFVDHVAVWEDGAGRQVLTTEPYHADPRYPWQTVLDGLAPHGIAGRHFEYSPWNPRGTTVYAFARIDGGTWRDKRSAGRLGPGGTRRSSGNEGGGQPLG